MTTLLLAAGPNDKALRLDSVLAIESNYPFPITVDSENMSVIRKRGIGAGIQVRVERGQNGSRPVGHAAGATITAGWGGGSGGVTVDNGSDPPAAVTTLVAAGADVSTPGTATLLNMRLLGPFPVAFNTAGLNNPNTGDGYEIASIIPAGALFTAFWMQDNQWDVAGTATLVAGRPNQGGAGGTLKSYAAQPGDAPAAATWEMVLDTDSPGAGWMLALEEMSLYAAFWPDAGNPTTGAANIYALISQPL